MFHSTLIKVFDSGRVQGDQSTINKKTNQESYLIFCFIETSVLIVRICILAMHSRFIGCLPLEKYYSLINLLIING
jgi:hypothetical protein